jgi:hypothetical protein
MVMGSREEKKFKCYLKALAFYHLLVDSLVPFLPHLFICIAAPAAPFKFELPDLIRQAPD